MSWSSTRQSRAVTNIEELSAASLWSHDRVSTTIPAPAGTRVDSVRNRTGSHDQARATHLRIGSNLRVRGASYASGPSLCRAIFLPANGIVNPRLRPLDTRWPTLREAISRSIAFRRPRRSRISKGNAAANSHSSWSRKGARASNA